MGWQEGVECSVELFEQGVEGSCGGRAQVGFEFGEGQFDGIEVRAIGWQMKELSSATFHGGGDGGTFVGRKIVGDDHITRAQRRPQALLEVSQEGRAIHGTVQEPGSRDAVMAQCGNEGEGLPVSMRHLLEAALGAWRSSIELRHFGVQARLIEEDQPLRVPVWSLLPPRDPLLLHVRTLLLGGVRHFF